MTSTKIIRLALVLCLLSGVSASYGQRLGFIFAHAAYSKTSGDLNKTHGFGIGGEAGAGLGLLGSSFLTFTTGYTHFDAKNSTGASNFSLVPLKLGVRHYILQKL